MDSSAALFNKPIIGLYLVLKSNPNKKARVQIAVWSDEVEREARQPRARQRPPEVRSTSGHTDHDVRS